MGMTHNKMEFVFAMAKHTDATLADCERLLRYGATYKRFAEEACNRELTGLEDAKWNGIKSRIHNLCVDMRKADALTPVAVFQNDPRGATVKIRVPDGFTNDLGHVGICVPTS